MNTISDDSPKITAVSRIDRPVRLPNTVSRPARRPCVVALAMTSDMVGPGVTASTKLAAKKVSRMLGDMAAAPERFGETATTGPAPPPSLT